MDVLEELDLESDQMDKIYDTLENLGIDTAGDDYLPDLADLGDDVVPPMEELEDIPEEEIVDPNTLVDSFGIDDPVRMYLKEIGKVNLLTPDEEVQLAQDMGKTVAEIGYNDPACGFDARSCAVMTTIDEQSGSGKLNLIIQLPYVIKTEARRQQAEKRRKDIEDQLSGSKYGVAYTDGTERVVQLNRPIDNNLMTQIEYLTSMLFSQLGLTQAILDGSADDKTMLNYYSRMIEPILAAIVDAIKRTFLTKTARSQKQSIMFFRDPFTLVPVNDIAEIADKFTRNEIMTSNEIRQKIGMMPSKDPKADELRNSNLSAPSEETAPTLKEEKVQNEAEV